MKVPYILRLSGTWYSTYICLSRTTAQLVSREAGVTFRRVLSSGGRAAQRATAAAVPNGAPPAKTPPPPPRPQPSNHSCGGTGGRRVYHVCKYTTNLVQSGVNMEACFRTRSTVGAAPLFASGSAVEGLCMPPQTIFAETPWSLNLGLYVDAVRK